MNLVTHGSGPGFRQADSEPGKQYVSQLVADIQPVNVDVMAKKLILFDGRGVGDVRRQCFADPFLGEEIRYPAPAEEQEGQPSFSPANAENLKLIYHLVKERGMTLDGAARCLKQNKGTISRDAELLERLQRVRALLEEVRAELEGECGGPGGCRGNWAAEAAEQSRRFGYFWKKPAAQESADHAGGDGAESKGPVQVIERGPRSEVGAETVWRRVSPGARRRKRRRRARSRSPSMNSRCFRRTF